MPFQEPRGTYPDGRPTEDSRLKKYSGLPTIILVLALTLGINSAVIVSDQRKEIEATYHEYIKEELALMRRVVNEVVLRNDLGTVEGILTEWGQARSDLVEIKAPAADGFVVAHYTRGTSAQHTAVQRQSILYRGIKLLVLEVRYDLDEMAKAVNKAGRRMAFSSLLLVTLLAFALWWILRKSAVQPLEREIVQRQQTEKELKQALEFLAIREERLDMALTETNTGLWDWNIQTGEASQYSYLRRR